MEIIRHVGKMRIPSIQFKYGLNKVVIQNNTQKTIQSVRPIMTTKMEIEDIPLYNRSFIIDQREIDQINGFMEIDDWEGITLSK